jgi:hypothetical protein
LVRINSKKRALKAARAGLELAKATGEVNWKMAFGLIFVSMRERGEIREEREQARAANAQASGSPSE